MTDTQPQVAIRAAIIDDERDACKRLQKAVQSTGVQVLALAHNTAEAEKCIIDKRPNVLFLDINMPGENAFQFLDRVNNDNFEIVFVTAYDEFAIRALKLNAVDYILKPFCQDDVDKAVYKLRARLREKVLIKELMSYNELLGKTAEDRNLSKITFKDTNGTEVVDFRNLYFIEAKGSYSHVVFRKQNAEKTLLVSHPISEYEEMLPADIFYRIHKSYLVNCQHIQKVMRDDFSVCVADKYTLPVSRRRYADMISFIKSQTTNRTRFADK